MRKEQRRTKADRRIEAICAQNRFSVTVVDWKSRKILSRYRDIRNLPAINAKTEEEIKQRASLLIREKYVRTYHDKKCVETGSLDYLIGDLLGIDFADEVIEHVFEKMQSMRFEVSEYRPILEYNYFYPDELSDDDIQLELGMSRTSYYRKKKEAVVLFGIILWNLMLEKCGINSAAIG